MSSVTDLILITTAGGDGGMEDEHPNVDRLNAWLAQRHQGVVTLRHVSGDFGPMQCEVFMGAKKGWLDLDGFLTEMRTIPWECPEVVQLLVKEEEDNQFRAYVP
jgi:hypothetical protein